MTGFSGDLRIALRTLAKRPGFVLVIVLTLPDADRLVALQDHQPPDDLTPADLPKFEDWRAGNQVFDFIAARFVRNFNLNGRHDPVRVRAALVAAGVELVNYRMLNCSAL